MVWMSRKHRSKGLDVRIEVVPARRQASSTAFTALLIAWVYFALGQWKNNPEAVRLGAMLMIIGFAWFVFAIAPAVVRLVWGVTPADLPGLKSGSGVASPPKSETPRPLR